MDILEAKNGTEEADNSDILFLLIDLFKSVLHLLVFAFTRLRFPGSFINVVNNEGIKLSAGLAFPLIETWGKKRPAFDMAVLPPQRPVLHQHVLGAVHAERAGSDHAQHQELHHQCKPEQREPGETHPPTHTHTPVLYGSTCSLTLVLGSGGVRQASVRLEPRCGGCSSGSEHFNSLRTQGM